MDIPEFFQAPAAASAGYYHHHSQITHQETRRHSDSKSFVDEFLNYPNDDAFVAPLSDDDPDVFEDMVAVGTGGGGVTSAAGTSSTLLDNNTSCISTASTTTGVIYPFVAGSTSSDNCRNFTDPHFSTELCVPYDDLAELEWVSHFAEESFSCEDLQNMHLISGIESPNNNNTVNTEFRPEPTPPNSNTGTTIFRPEMAVPAKARSKRSRAPPCNWTSRLLAVTPSPPPASSTTTTTTTTNQMTSAMLSSSESSIGSSLEKKAIKATLKKKESGGRGAMGSNNSEGRRCLHCATDQTPQWRTGPMGPKTLCNACGVRYKSGRLLPEYRPAASPTFLLAKHSNSHRKVMELRRQNEVTTVHQQHHLNHHQQQQFIHQNMMFNVANVEDFLIHTHIGPDFRQLI